MKYSLIKLIFRVFMIAGMFVPVKSQAQKFMFWFVAPRNTISSNFAAPLDSVLCPIGYARTAINAATVAKFRTVAPQRIVYIYNQLQPGNALRNNVDKVMLNSGGTVKIVEYWLADDQTGLSGLPADTNNVFMQYLDNGKKYVWPAAFNWQMKTPGFGGVAMFGEHEMEDAVANAVGGVSSIDEVVLHESSHTQWTGNSSKWGAINNSLITYGADGMHYFNISEMLGDQEGALNEGLATAYGYIMNNVAAAALLDFYKNPDDRYFVESKSVLAGAKGLYEVKERKEGNIFTKDNDGNSKKVTYDDGSPVVVYYYKWKNVPGFYLLFAEITSTAFFTLFRNETYSNKDTVFNMIGNVAFSMSADLRKRFLTYACNRLALRMEAFNNKAGKNDPSKISSIFPFALLDLLTHFGMTDAEYQADYRRNYPDKEPRAYAEYFSRRVALKALVQADMDASPIRFAEALQKIKTYCQQPANMF